MSETYNRIYESISELEVIDSHEHLPHREEARNHDTDVLQEYLIHYFSCDLISAGLSRADYAKVTDTALPLMDRWRIVEPYWDLCRFTGYGRALDLSVNGLYGIPAITGDTIEAVDEAFQASLQPGHFHRVLKEKSQIKIALLDSHLDCDRQFFRSVLRLDHLIAPGSGRDMHQVEQDASTRITSFMDWLEACETILERGLARGVVALKSGLAYERSLLYEPVTFAQAEEDFLDVFRLKRSPDWVTQCEQTFHLSKRFQDYMMHFVLKLANARNLTFQFHTGLQEGNGNMIYHSDPALLSNLFLQYPDVDFDLFHIGYPYQHVLSALAKNFPNVFIDMCWAHIISPTASIHALVEWIDSVPISKMIAFGGDYVFIDAVFGHQLMARQHVAKALTVKVNEGVFDVEQAVRIAAMLFLHNPMRIFKLDKHIAHA